MQKRLIALLSLSLLVLGLLAGCSRKGVDPNLIGTWRAKERMFLRSIDKDGFVTDSSIANKFVDSDTFIPILSAEYEWCTETNKMRMFGDRFGESANAAFSYTIRDGQMTVYSNSGGSSSIYRKLEENSFDLDLVGRWRAGDISLNFCDSFTGTLDFNDDVFLFAWEIVDRRLEITFWQDDLDEDLSSIVDYSVIDQQLRIFDNIYLPYEQIPADSYTRVGGN